MGRFSTGPLTDLKYIDWPRRPGAGHRNAAGSLLGLVPGLQELPGFSNAPPPGVGCPHTSAV